MYLTRADREPAKPEARLANSDSGSAHHSVSSIKLSFSLELQACLRLKPNIVILRFCRFDAKFNLFKAHVEVYV